MTSISTAMIITHTPSNRPRTMVGMLRVVDWTAFDPILLVILLLHDLYM